MVQDVRWKQRFQNFERAVALLREPIDRGVATLSDLEKEGTIQRFEVAVELAWKTLKDYLEEEGRIVNPVTPRNTFKEAFGAGILRDGQVWIDMMEHRNLLSHTYDAATFHRAVLAIRDRYFAAIDELRLWLAGRGGFLTTKTALSEGALELIRGVLARHEEVTGALLFGSRAKGTAAPASDVDLALEGIEDPLRAEAIASELEELPLPFRFDVQALAAIQNPSLLEHIARVGVRIYASGVKRNRHASR